MRGLVVGWTTVRHSGCQSRMTTAMEAIMRRISKTAVRLRCGLRFQVRNDKVPMRIKAMMPIHCQCKARTLEEFGDLLMHDAEEFILVVQGRVEVHTEFYGPRTLDVGDGVYIDSRMGHAYLNVGEGEAWIVSVNLNH